MIIAVSIVLISTHGVITIKFIVGYRLQPHFYLLDAEGNILQQWLGMTSGSAFEVAFKNLIQKMDPKPE